MLDGASGLTQPATVPGTNPEREKEEKGVGKEKRVDVGRWAAQFAAGGVPLLLELELEPPCTVAGFEEELAEGQFRQKCPVSPQAKQN